MSFHYLMLLINTSLQHTHTNQQLFFLHLFTDLFCKDFSTFVRINCSYFVGKNISICTLYPADVVGEVVQDEDDAPNNINVLIELKKLWQESVKAFVR